MTKLVSIRCDDLKQTCNLQDKDVLNITWRSAITGIRYPISRSNTIQQPVKLVAAYCGLIFKNAYSMQPPPQPNVFGSLWKTT